MGPAVGEVARRLGRPLLPWQQDRIDVAYEYDPETRLFRYREHDILVPRQSGKTTLLFAKKVHRLAVMSRTLGPQRSSYTAQTRLASRKKLERDFADLLRASISFVEIEGTRRRPRKTTEWRLTLNNGSEAIQFGGGNYLQIDAPSRTGQHGDTLDDADIDEAFAHQTDDAEQAVRPAMITRVNAQLWVVSTAGDGRSVYLWRKVLSGRAAAESGEHGSVCYTEYSAPDDADPADPETWWACMPALGHTVTEETIAAEWNIAQRDGEEGIDRFRRAYLNQWPEVPVLDEEEAPSRLPYAEWLKLADPAAERGSRVVFGVDVGVDRLAHIAVAWRRPDGDVQVMLADTNVSPLRTPARLRELAIKYKGPVALGGTSASLEGEVKGAYLVSGSDFAASCGRFEDLFRDSMLHHGNQDELNEAVRLAEWKDYGSSGERALVLKDNPSVGPLAAAVRAVHGLIVKPRPPAARALVEDTRSSSGGEKSIFEITF